MVIVQPSSWFLQLSLSFLFQPVSTALVQDRNDTHCACNHQGVRLDFFIGLRDEYIRILALQSFGKFLSFISLETSYHFRADSSGVCFQPLPKFFIWLFTLALTRAPSFRVCLLMFKCLYNRQTSWFLSQSESCMFQRNLISHPSKNSICKANRYSSRAVLVSAGATSSAASLVWSSVTTGGGWFFMGSFSSSIFFMQIEGDLVFNKVSPFLSLLSQRSETGLSLMARWQISPWSVVTLPLQRYFMPQGITWKAVTCTSRG